LLTIRCSKWGNNAQEFSKQGAVEAMVEYLATDDVMLKRSAVRALHQLAKDAESCIKMHDKGAVKVCILGCVCQGVYVFTNHS
jgi:hypothetical protein